MIYQLASCIEFESSVKNPLAEEYYSNANTPTPFLSALGRVYRFTIGLLNNYIFKPVNRSLFKKLLLDEK